MAQITVELALRPKWWFRPALAIAFILLWLNLIDDVDSAEHWSGRISAEERVAKWLADFAFWVEAR